MLSKSKTQNVLRAPELKVLFMQNSSCLKNYYYTILINLSKTFKFAVNICSDSFKVNSSLK